MAREPKPKAINYTRIDLDDDPEKIHPAITKLVKANHPHILRARIGAAWRRKLKRDKDGLLVLGKCVKASDLNKQFSDLDFVIVLNQEAWASLSDAQRTALLDHELCHANVAKDKNGAVKEDEDGRPVFRVRKHDLEEFREIVSRHGCYKADIEEFVRTAMDSKKPPGPTLLDGVTDDIAGRVMDHIDKNSGKIAGELQRGMPEGVEVEVKVEKRKRSAR